MATTYGKARADPRRNESPRDEVAYAQRLKWRFLGLLTFFPVTAVLHHAIFCRHRCLTNILGTSETFDWLSWDRSPWLGMVLAVVTAAVVSRTRFASIRPWVASLLISFLPLSIWLWDIPGLGGVVCRTFHDGRIGLRSWHLYLLGVALYVPIAFWLKRARQLTTETSVPVLTTRRAGRVVGVWPSTPGSLGDTPPGPSPPGF